MAGFASLTTVDLECSDPPVLAEFYHQLLGYEVEQSQADYAVLRAGPLCIRFGQVAGYLGPGWPDAAGPKRFHLDVEVADVAEAVERSLRLGASKPAFQPGGDRWTVLTDPGGHPFCLCPPQPG